MTVQDSMRADDEISSIDACPLQLTFQTLIETPAKFSISMETMTRKYLLRQGVFPL